MYVLYIYISYFCIGVCVCVYIYIYVHTQSPRPQKNPHSWPGVRAVLTFAVEKGAGTKAEPYLESQWLIILGYFKPIMVYFWV